METLSVGPNLRDSMGPVNPRTPPRDAELEQRPGFVKHEVVVDRAGEKINRAVVAEVDGVDAGQVVAFGGGTEQIHDLMHLVAPAHDEKIIAAVGVLKE